MIWELVALALGLSADATAVSVARGVSAPEIAARDGLRVALLFGGFHAVMPLLGSLVGRVLGTYVGAFDHWIVFGVLAGLGAKMLREARAAPNRAVTLPERDPFGLRVLTMLAVAISLDAFAVGITLPMIGAPLALSISVIGLVTAVTSTLGLYAGRRFGAQLGKHVDVVGGVLLMAVGLKLLLEHLSSGI
jgi:putative Mn2+ efflux pump MntP